MKARDEHIPESNPTHIDEPPPLPLIMLPGIQDDKGGRSPSTESDDLTPIHGELRKLEYEHATNRAPLPLRVLNGAQALTKDLPPEIMSLIFQYTRLQAYRCEWIKCTLNLGHTSFHWRQIVWSTPQLWTSMEVKMERTHSVNPIIQLLRLHLHNVRGLPLFLHISLSEDQLIMEECFSEFVKLLSDEEGSGKIRSLSLSHPPGLLTDYISSGTFPHLESLKLYSYSTMNGQEFSLINLPYLHRLSLIQVAPTKIELSWSIITSLTLDTVPIDITMKIFVQCPNLVEADIESPVSSTNTNGLPWANTITFPHLKNLTWCYNPDPVCAIVLGRICAPSLRELEWYGNPGQTSALPALPNFPSLPALTTLHFNYLEDGSPLFFQSIFSGTKDLQTLQFSYCDDSSIEAALSILITAGEPETPVVYLPLLNEFDIHDVGFTPNEETQWMIFKLLERQWRSGVDFLLEMRMPFDPKVEQAIESFGVGWGLTIGKDCGATYMLDGDFGWKSDPESDD